MNLAERLETWGEAHHPKILDIIRIALGIFLCYKGYTFLTNEGTLTGLMELSSPFSGFVIIMLAHYIAFAHIVGGIFLMLGLFTRLACILQIPILIGAIIFVNINATYDVFRTYHELFLSVLVLLLLIYFMIAGNGPWSIKISSDDKEE